MVALSAPQTLTPLNDFVLLLPDPVKPYHEYKKYDKIIVPDRFDHGPEDRPVWGIVQAKGQACRNSWISPGRHILIGKWDGARIPYNGVEYIVVKEDMVIAVDA